MREPGEGTEDREKGYAPLPYQREAEDAANGAFRPLGATPVDVTIAK
jgi:hypothetical protein